MASSPTALSPSAPWPLSRCHLSPSISAATLGASTRLSPMLPPPEHSRASFRVLPSSSPCERVCLCVCVSVCVFVSVCVSASVCVAHLCPLPAPRLRSPSSSAPSSQPTLPPRHYLCSPRWSLFLSGCFTSVSLSFPSLSLFFLLLSLAPPVIAVARCFHGQGSLSPSSLSLCFPGPVGPIVCSFTPRLPPPSPRAALLLPSLSLPVLLQPPARPPSPLSRRGLRPLPPASLSPAGPASPFLLPLRLSHQPCLSPHLSASPSTPPNVPVPLCHPAPLCASSPETRAASASVRDRPAPLSPFPALSACSARVRTPVPRREGPGGGWRGGSQSA